MQLLHSFSDVDAAHVRPSVVAVGTFDGVHLGHQQLIRAVVNEAHAKGVQSAVVTFFPHPRVVLGRAPAKYLTLPEEKAAYISALGIDIMIVHEFTQDTVHTPASQFVQWMADSLAMRSLWIGNAINLVLDPCFIFGWGPFPELGVTGSAIATTIGRSCSVIYQCYKLFGGDGRVPVRRDQFKPDFEVMKNLFRISLGGMLQMFIATSAWIFLMSIVGKFGSAAQAGYTVAIRIVWMTRCRRGA